MYYEPFLGSGALFFLLRPKQAVLSDSCGPLVATYDAVKRNPSAVCRYLSPLRSNRTTYYRIRSGTSTAFFKSAAHFIYLNRNCWNGLYRVNSSGGFNVPFGAPKTQQPIDKENIRACAESLTVPGVTLKCSDFYDSAKHARAGDFVFLDPPYVTCHNDNGFIDYNEVLFSWSDQVRLARLAFDLAAQGTHVIICNADHGDVRKLYRGFGYRRLHRHSTLASRSSARSRVSEMVFYSK